MKIYFTIANINQVNTSLINLCREETWPKLDDRIFNEKIQNSMKKIIKPEVSKTYITKGFNSDYIFHTLLPNENNINYLILYEKSLETLLEIININNVENVTLDFQQILENDITLLIKFLKEKKESNLIKNFYVIFKDELELARTKEVWNSIK